MLPGKAVFAGMWVVASLHLTGAGIEVRGRAFEIDELRNGAQAFMNRTYTWEDVPEALTGWRFTRLNGGLRSELTATATAAGTLYLATTAGGVALPGWRLVPEWRFRYTDHNRTVVRVFSRRVRAGETVLIPQGSWTGCMLLAPDIAGRATEPEVDLRRVPGVVIDHSPALGGNYIGCPSIERLPDGELVASHSFFGPGSRKQSTVVFRSRDHGKNWTRVAAISRQWFSTLFQYEGALYLMGVGGKGSHVAIRRSDDGGVTWTEPVDGTTGLLLSDASYHSAPVPVVVDGSRIWRAMEDRSAGGRWPAHFRAFMMSAPLGADLLAASSWTVSNRLAGNKAWLDREFKGWLEGNAVVAPDGGMVNILRADTWVGGKAAVIRIGPAGKASSFDPETGFIDFPGGAKKFTIRFDPVSKLYWSLTNPVNEDERAARTAGTMRNTLALVSSPDLIEWTVRRKVLHHPDPVNHAFQYVDWQFDGEDLAAVSRTAFDDGLGGARNQHDANLFTFHRVTDFRRSTGAGKRVDSVPGTGESGRQKPP